MGITSELLAQMAGKETLSPMGFSNSVHHTAIGYWSLATGNRRAMRAVAGGEASFCYGFLDAIGLLATTRIRRRCCSSPRTIWFRLHLIRQSIRRAGPMRPRFFWSVR